jgi:hypothetical protein
MLLVFFPETARRALEEIAPEQPPPDKLSDRVSHRGT